MVQQQLRVDRCAGRPFPSYRMFIILLGLIVFVAVGVLLRRTRLA